MINLKKDEWCMRSKYIHYAGLVMAAAIWGVNFGISRLEMNTFGPILFAFLRFSLALPFFFLLLKIKEGTIGIPFRVAAQLMMIGIFGVTGLEIMIMYSIKFTTLANASLLNVAPWPIFAALLAPLFTREVITRRVMIGGGVAMIGVCIIILSGGEGLDLSSKHMLGNLIALAVSFMGAIYNLSCMPLMRQYSALRVSTWFIFFGVVFMFPLTWTAWGQVAWTSLAATDYAAIFYNVIFCTVLAFIVWNHSMYHVGAARANFFRYAVPAAAVIAGYVLFGEKITLWQIIGTLFMGAGLVWISIERSSPST
jgi:drug/metabolite transporter (DMT)-like permease